MDRKRKQEESLREGKVQQARKKIEEEREKQRVEAENAAREEELKMTRLLEEMERNRSEARRQAYRIGRESDDEEEDEIDSREEKKEEIWFLTRLTRAKRREPRVRCGNRRD